MSTGDHATRVAPAGATLLPGGHVPCLPLLSRFPGGALMLGTLVASTSCATAAAHLRGSPQYRAPAVVLAYPARGTALPADKPVVLFRFALREADDPVDVASFRATVDGIDRTAQFRVTSSEAWGSLGDTTAAPATPVIAGVATGPHTVAARICSARGACGGVAVVVEVRAWERALSSAPLSRQADKPNNTSTASRTMAASRSSNGAGAGA